MARDQFLYLLILFIFLTNLSDILFVFNQPNVENLSSPFVFLHSNWVDFRISAVIHLALVRNLHGIEVVFPDPVLDFVSLLVNSSKHEI